MPHLWQHSVIVFALAAWVILCKSNKLRHLEKIKGFRSVEKQTKANIVHDILLPSYFYHIKINIFTVTVSDVNTTKINIVFFHENVPHFRQIYFNLFLLIVDIYSTVFFLYHLTSFVVILCCDYLSPSTCSDTIVHKRQFFPSCFMSPSQLIVALS